MGPNSGHRIHTACLQKLQAADPNWECPRCEDLRRRADIGADDGVTYCAAIRGGFKASTKIQAAVDACKAVVAKNEKIIVFSFFKAGLDCVEGALDEEGVECLRFDVCGNQPVCRVHPIILHEFISRRQRVKSP